jgi:BTB/POZ domain
MSSKVLDSSKICDQCFVFCKTSFYKTYCFECKTHICKECSNANLCKCSSKLKKYSRKAFKLKTFKNCIADEIIRNNSAVMDDESFMDFTFVVQKTVEFKVHKAVLAAISPVFRTMFTTNFQEGKSNECHISEIQPFHFRHLLRYIYLGEIPQNVGDSLPELYANAHFYQIDRLKKICEKEMMKSIDYENALEIYKIACQHELEELKVVSWKIVKRFEQFV